MIRQCRFHRLMSSSFAFNWFQLVAAQVTLIKPTQTYSPAVIQNLRNRLVPPPHRCSHHLVYFIKFKRCLKLIRQGNQSKKFPCSRCQNVLRAEQQQRWCTTVAFPSIVDTLLQQNSKVMQSILLTLVIIMQRLVIMTVVLLIEVRFRVSRDLVLFFLIYVQNQLATLYGTFSRKLLLSLLLKSLCCRYFVKEKAHAQHRRVQNLMQLKQLLIQAKSHGFLANNSWGQHTHNIVQPRESFFDTFNIYR